MALENTDAIKAAYNGRVTATLNAAGEKLRAIKSPSPELVEAITHFNEAIDSANQAATEIGTQLKEIDAGLTAALADVKELQKQLGIPD